MIHQHRIHLHTSGHRDMHDITGEVADIVKPRNREIVITVQGE